MGDRERTEGGACLDDRGRSVIHPWDVRPATRATLPEGLGPGEGIESIMSDLPILSNRETGLSGYVRRFLR